MNGKVARALRSYTKAMPVDPVINHREYKRIKREWSRAPHRERGRLRALLEGRKAHEEQKRAIEAAAAVAKVAP